ncbi:MAG TPA: hypothetical protein VGO00_09330 [Kofleriaceae bacterium]|jgi:hypothetical protein|nr:hypothetical protein [Kofleriaceae bacterium]
METSGNDDLPLSKGVIWVLCLLLTPLCGAILYYVWKKDYPVAANYANKVSWLSWVLWIGLYGAYYAMRR